jgi:hypothetical protein
LGKSRTGIEAAHGQSPPEHRWRSISVIAYQSDYVAAREELKVIDATARIKKCKILDRLQSNSDVK